VHTNGECFHPQKGKDVTISHAIVGDELVAFVFREGGDQVASQKTPDDHGVPHEWGSEDFHSQKDQKDRESHGNVRSRSVPQANVTVSGAQDPVGIIRAANAAAPETNSGARELDTYHGDRHAEHVGGEDTL